MIYESKQLRVIAAMPAFNEERYIGSMVLRTRQFVDEVVVVDDGSADATAEIARLAGASVVRHETNRGYGAAIQSIIAEARKRDADVLLLIDADAQHNPAEIPSLVKPLLDGYDLVIGTRREQGENIPFYRRIGLKILRRSTNILSDAKLSDTESGFRGFSRKAIAMLKLRENGMAASAETVAEASRLGLRMTEVPISIIYSRDSSTLNPVAHGMQVLARVVAMISERRPLFFFGLGGSILVALSLVAGGMLLRILAPPATAALALAAALFLVVGICGIFTGLILHVLVKRS
ncbi:MAG: glycosyltransferase family 2 protein [Chloroflexi bacterium]|nr:glycosyltransferase family 2 protein [Chloroflexota bacterium]